MVWQKEKQNSQCKTQNTQEYLSCKCLALLIYYDDMWGCISKNSYSKKLKHGHKKQRILILACLQTHHRKFWFNLLEFQKYLLHYFKNVWYNFLFISLPSSVCCQHLPLKWLTPSYPSLIELICRYSLKEEFTFFPQTTITFTLNFKITFTHSKDFFQISYILCYLHFPILQFYLMQFYVILFILTKNCK